MVNYLCEDKWSGFHQTAGELVAAYSHLSEAASSRSLLLESDVGSFFTFTLQNNKSNQMRVQLVPTTAYRYGYVVTILFLDTIILSHCILLHTCLLISPQFSEWQLKQNSWLQNDTYSEGCKMHVCYDLVIIHNTIPEWKIRTSFTHINGRVGYLKEKSVPGQRWTWCK